MGNEFQNLKFDGHCLITNYDTRYNHRKENKEKEGILISAFDNEKNVISSAQDADIARLTTIISSIAELDGDTGTFSVQDLVELKALSEQYPKAVEYLGIKSVRYDEKRGIATIKFKNDKLIRMDFDAAPRGGWKTFEDILYESESKGKGGYNAENKKTHYLGRYQIGEKALADIGWYKMPKGQRLNSWKGTWTEKARKMGVKSKADFLKNPEAQEAAHKESKQYVWKKYIVKQHHLDKYVGKFVDGCYITESSLLGGAHLIGATGLANYLKNPSEAKAKDGNGTHVSKYIMETQNCDVSEITGHKTSNLKVYTNKNSKESEDVSDNLTNYEDPRAKQTPKENENGGWLFGLKTLLPFVLLGTGILAGPKMFKAKTAKSLLNAAKSIPFGDMFNKAAKTVTTSKLITSPSTKKLAPYMIGIGIGALFTKMLHSCAMNHFAKDKSSDNTDEPEQEYEFDSQKSVLQNILDSGKADIKKEGDFDIVTYNYKIKRGDTLYKISNKFGSQLSVISTNNKIQNPDVIEEGDNLKIQKLCYTVKKGDTLKSISEKFGISVDMLKDTNILEDDKMLKKGQIIELPGFLHVMSEDDSVYGLSKKYDISPEKLTEINIKEGKGFETGDTVKVLYNDAFFEVPKENRKIEVDYDTNEKIEVIDAPKKIKKMIGSNRPLLEKIYKKNGKVIATRAVFEPTAKGKLTGKTIIVNAGHGYNNGASGIDAGARGRKGMNDEWIINYDNAMRLKDKLCAQGAKVIFLQGKVGLVQNAVDNKKKNKADMFISVHVNSCPKKEMPDRMGIFYRNKDVSGKPKQNSIKFAKMVSKNFTKAEGKVDNVKCKPETNEARTGVLKTPLNSQGIPGIIWEVAFMSSSKGRKRMSDENLMKNYADVMTQSVIEYFS